jgi:hypothetical protein
VVVVAETATGHDRHLGFLQDQIGHVRRIGDHPVSPFLSEEAGDIGEDVKSPFGHGAFDAGHGV